MDLTSLVGLLYSLVYLASVLGSVVPFVIRVALRRVTVDSPGHMRQIDRYITRANRGDTRWQMIHTDDTPIPEATWHLVWVDAWSPVVAHKQVSSRAYDSRGQQTTTHEYSLYALSRRALTAVLTETASNPRMVVVRQFESTSPWDSRLATRMIMPPGEGILRVKQAAAVDTIVQRFVKRRHSVLLIGPSGSGKSSTALFVAGALKHALSPCVPSVVLGYSPTAKGASVLNFIPTEITDDTPYILVLDEIDDAFRMAMRGEDAKEWSSVAQSKTPLCAFFDRLATIKNLVMIGTTNLSRAELDDKYAPFIREGRFDVKIDF